MTLFEFLMTEEGIDKISLVSSPAIGVNFITLSKQEKQTFKETKKGELIGAVLIPNKPIYRIDDDGQEYYGYFSQETVKAIADRYMEMKKQDVWNVEHEKDVTGVVVLESWLTEGEDKSKKYGFNVPDGTWMVRVKVNNDKVKQQILEEGSIKGFSIEGNFQLKEIRQQLQKVVEEKMEKILRDTVARKLKSLLP